MSVRLAVSTAAVRAAVVSRAPPTVCGLDAVETGGAPLLTDSGPHAPTRTRANGATARHMKLRDLERRMMRGIYTSTESETRASVRAVDSVAKANRDDAQRVAVGADDG